MTRKFTFFIISAFLTLCIGCNAPVTSSTTYFGGKIINPKSEFVVLHKMDKVIDTFFINEDHKFLGELDSIAEGLYYFSHGIENQFVYIEPKDSLILSLNTWEFDESLVFSGVGAERNNILIDCFLQFEKDDKKFYQYNTLKPTEFKIKTDTIITHKLNTYEEYVKSHPTETDGFREILKTALTFPIYARIEGYPNSHAKRLQLADFPKIPSDFYNHRSEIASSNNDALIYYPPYSMYMTNFLYNTTYSKGYKPMQNSFSSKFTIDLLKTIDANISSEVFKNAYLKHTLISHFYSRSTCDVDDEEFDVFLALSSNEKDKELVRKILKDNKLLHANQKMMDFKITDFTNAERNLKDLIKNKTTLLFFWNYKHNTKASLAARINFLANKYPEIQFITIEIEKNQKDQIADLDIKNQFYIANHTAQTDFLSSRMNRTVLVNRKGIVTNGFASISSKNIYTQLTKLSKN